MDNVIIQMIMVMINVMIMIVIVRKSTFTSENKQIIVMNVIEHSDFIYFSRDRLSIWLLMTFRRQIDPKQAD